MPTMSDEFLRQADVQPAYEGEARTRARLRLLAARMWEAVS